MDIGNQQRVIIVEEDAWVEDPAPTPAEMEAELAAELEQAVAWPLPLDLEPDPVS